MLTDVNNTNSFQWRMYPLIYPWYVDIFQLYKSNKICMFKNIKNTVIIFWKVPTHNNDYCYHPRKRQINKTKKPTKLPSHIIFFRKIIHKKLRESGTIFRVLKGQKKSTKHNMKSIPLLNLEIPASIIRLNME